jgi:hypothetical protein
MHRRLVLFGVPLGWRVGDASEGADGGFLDDQRGGDLPVGQAAGNQPEHVAFAGGELLELLLARQVRTATGSPIRQQRSTASAAWRCVIVCAYFRELGGAGKSGVCFRWPRNARLWVVASGLPDPCVSGSLGQAAPTGGLPLSGQDRQDGEVGRVSRPRLRLRDGKGECRFDVAVQTLTREGDRGGHHAEDRGGEDHPVGRVEGVHCGGLVDQRPCGAGTAES